MLAITRKTYGDPEEWECDGDVWRCVKMREDARVEAGGGVAGTTLAPIMSRMPQPATGTQHTRVFVLAFCAHF